MLIAFSRHRLAALFVAASAMTRLGRRSSSAMVRAAKSGDREAFEELIDLYSEPLRRFCLRRVEAGDVDDVLQETWLAAWDGLRLFERDDNFKAWVFSICFKKIQDHWRRHHASHPHLRMGIPADVPYSSKEYARLELQESLSGFWNSCSADQREILTLYYSDRLTLNEISRVVGRNLSTVKYQFYRVHDQAAKDLAEVAGVLLQKEPSV